MNILEGSCFQVALFTELHLTYWVRRLLTHPNMSSLNSKAVWGESPLMGAVARGQLEVVKALVEVEGIDVDTEVNISSYPASRIIFFLSCRNIKFRGFRADIFRSGGFVQKYWSVIVARYCYVVYFYVLSSHAPRQFGFD